MEKIKVSKHLLKLAFKRRNPLNDETKFRSGQGRHQHAPARNNERVALKRCRWDTE